MFILVLNEEDNSLADLLLLAVTATFDIDRLAEKVKNTRAVDGDPDNMSHDHLAKFFLITALGPIDCPCTVVDEHGRVIVWYLPDIIAPFRVVSEIIVCPLFHV